MHTTLQKGGRSVEEFLGRSDKGDLGEAVRQAIKEAKAVYGSASIRWELTHISGISSPRTPACVVATIKAKAASDE